MKYIILNNIFISHSASVITKDTKQISINIFDIVQMTLLFSSSETRISNFFPMPNVS